MNLINRTLFTIPILVFLISLFGFLLYRKFTERIQASDNPVIGTLTFKTRTIQRKYDNEVVWESITTKTEIRNKDTIRTENLADAVLTLEDGTKIQIGENSMILVDFSDNNWNLNFAYGTVAANRSGENDSVLSIQSGDSKIVMGSGGVTLDKAGENLNVKLDSGQAKLTNGGNEQDIEKDQIANLSSDGINVNDSAFFLVSPADKSIKLTNGTNERISFSWRKENPQIKDLVKLEVASDIGFKRILNSQNLKSLSTSLTLNPGSYYWRLSYLDSKGKNQYTGKSRFTIEKKENLRLFTPQEGQVFSSTSDSNSIPIGFSWSKIKLVSSYKIQIAKDQNFSNILKEKETFNNSISFTDLALGNYFVRIIGKASIEGIDQLVSNVNSFSITNRTELVKPTIYEPKNGKSISKLSIPDSGLFFSWKDLNDYKEYNILLSNNVSFSNPIFNKKVSGNFVKVQEDLNPGKYFWKLIGTSQSGNQKESDVFEFQITNGVNLVLLKPNNGSKVELDDKDKVTLNWKPFANVGETFLEISNNKNMSDLIINEKVSGTSFDYLTKSSGLYFWRLVWKLGNERTESEIFNFNASKAIPIANLINPSKNQTINMTTKDSLDFSWARVNEADLYQLVVTDVSGLKEKNIIDVKLKDTKYILTDLTKLNQGKFRWEVKVLVKNLDGSYSISNSNKADFFIKLDSGTITKILTSEKVYVE
ncbi:MAG: FecR domain-containing protein [Leptospira sp.]|nr:FecR domain-containing protein [Leptospira sp.]NCS95644.1 FecR domain-containing protein [Leptospira sp.]